MNDSQRVAVPSLYYVASLQQLVRERSAGSGAFLVQIRTVLRWLHPRNKSTLWLDQKALTARISSWRRFI